MLQHGHAYDPAQHTLSYCHLQAQKYYSFQWQLDQVPSKSSASVDLLLAEKTFILIIMLVYLLLYRGTYIPALIVAEQISDHTVVCMHENVFLNHKGRTKDEHA